LVVSEQYERGRKLEERYFIRCNLCIKGIFFVYAETFTITS